MMELHPIPPEAIPGFLVDKEDVKTHRDEWAIIQDLREEIEKLRYDAVQDRKRISKLEDQRDRETFEPLKQKLIDILNDEPEKAIKVSDLYYKKIKKRTRPGLLDISSATASRLKQSCIADDRFKIVRSLSGNEVIKLSSHR